MSVKPHQHAHLANGIRRIKQAISNCDLPVSEVGTMFKCDIFDIDLMNKFIQDDILKSILVFTINAPYN